MRRINKLAKTRRRQLSRSEKLLARWDIFITNAPESAMSLKQVSQVYSLRWTIELIFKQLKSTLDIHKWNHANEFRLKCEIIASLIMATFIFSCQSAAQSLSVPILKHEISIEKIFKLFKNSGELLLIASRLSTSKLFLLFNQIFRSILKSCLKESRQNRPSSMEYFLKLCTP